MKQFALQQAPGNAEVKQLLTQLKDIHQPATISWWPPAPGWWLLGILLIGLCTLGIFYLLRWRRQRRALRYRNEGMRLLRELNLAQPEAILTINTLLKRVAIVSFGHSNCAQLTGQRWITFLERTAPITMPQQAKTALLQSLYSNRPTTYSALTELRDYALEWVKSHQRQTPKEIEEPINVEVKGV
ncbi:MAG: DUF4381 domain-containing protein [Gammaproteobacteria bacterium]|nr:DUF4381 domain-containing protein [Gammaproteobacteria bacterium]